MFGSFAKIGRAAPILMCTVTVPAHLNLKGFLNIFFQCCRVLFALCSIFCCLEKNDVIGPMKKHFAPLRESQITLNSRKRSKFPNCYTVYLLFTSIIFIIYIPGTRGIRRNITRNIIIEGNISPNPPERRVYKCFIILKKYLD